MAKLLGARIYLEMPEKEKSKIVVDDNTKEALNKELLNKLSRLKVVAVGSGITEPALVIGCEVLVDPSALSKAHIIPKEGYDVILVSIFDVIEIL
jgi:hypothetical protein